MRTVREDVVLCGLCLLVAVTFSISHLPLFWDFPVPEFRKDWGSYYDVVREILAGDAPNVTGRPPGYPLFVILGLKLTGSHVGLVALQSALTLGALLFATYVAWRVDRWFGAFTAVAFAIFSLRQTGVRIDNLVLTEPLYRALIIYSVAALIHGLATGRARWLALASASSAALIMTKPAGQWILVLVAIAVAGLLLGRFAQAGTSKWRLAAAAVLPGFIVLSSLSAYNKITAGTYAWSSNGGVNLASTTWYLWAESNWLTDVQNEVVRKTRRNGFDCERLPKTCRDRKHLETIKTSDNLLKVWRAHKKLFGWQNGLRSFLPWDILLDERPIGRYILAATIDLSRYPPSQRDEIRGKLNDTLTTNEGSVTAEMRAAGAYLRPIALVSVLENPWLSAKKTLANVHAFYGHRGRDRPFYTSGRAEYNVRRGKAYARTQPNNCDPALAPFMVVGRFCDSAFPDQDMQANIKQISKGKGSIILSLYNSLYSSLYKNIFNGYWVGYAFLPVLFLSALGYIATLGRSFACFVAFVITAACFGSGMVVVLASFASWKYAEPTVPLMFWSIAAVALLRPRRLGSWLSRRAEVAQQRLDRRLDPAGAEDRAPAGPEP